MQEHQNPAAGPSKPCKPTRFKFSPAARTFLRDYFHNTSKAPKKKEREQIFAHLKELGDTEVTDTRISSWFGANRQKERKRPSLPLLTSAPDPNETKWVDAHHETLWPSLTRETLKDVEELYTELIADNPNAKIPCDAWATILDAKPVHVRMWCKAQERQPRRKSRLAAASMADAPSQVTEERSQLPTPGNSISPEPPTTSVPRPLPSPDVVKDEPPASPVVDTTPCRPPPITTSSNDNGSLGLHEAIQSAFSTPLYPPPPTTQPLKPLLTPGPEHRRKSLPRSSHGTLQIVSRPTSPLIPAPADATTLASTSLPPPAITPPLPSEAHCEPPTSPLPEEPIAGPSKQPDRDLARERATLAAGVAGKLEELTGIFESTHGLAQFAGSINNISRRNEQFLTDVSAGRFAQLRLTGAHLPDGQTARVMPEYNPFRALTEWYDGKGKQERGRDGEVEMEMD